jgi:D-inositol-3-phosphate glycosyltransferase
MARLKTIVLIGPSWPLRGGISLFNVRLFKALTQKNIDTHLIGFTRQYPALFFPGQSQDTPEFKPAVGKKMIDTCNPFSWLKTYRHIKTLQPDAIVFSWWHFWFWPCFKVMVHFLSNAGFPVIFLCHNYQTHDREGIWDWFSTNVMKKADGLLFLSDFTRDQRREKYPLKISLFHPYYEWERWPVRELDAWSNKILLAGCMKSYKGLEQIGLGLLNHDSKLKMTIAGDVYNNKILKRIRVLEKKFKNRIRVIPEYCSDENLVKLMDEHDLLLCSHRKATQSGMAAFAFGRQRPVVVTPVGGLGEQIHPKTGIVAEKNTSESLMKAVSMIYEHSPLYWAKGIKEQQEKKSFAYFAGKICESIEKIVKA